MLRSANGFDAQGLCGVEYRWLEREDVRGEAIDGWRALVGKIEVLEIEGNHFEVFKGDKVSLLIMSSFFLWNLAPSLLGGAGWKGGAKANKGVNLRSKQILRR